MRTPKLKSLSGPAYAIFLLCVVATFLFPAWLGAEGLASEALSSFPADTQQLAYTNLPEIRSLPVYPQIRERLLNRQFRYFLDFLRSMGMDPEKDVDELALGWRGSPSDAANFFGLAEGRFRPEQAREFFSHEQLPSHQHEGVDLYTFGSGEGSADFFFAFFSPSLAAFGHLNDLTALLDARSGLRPALDSNSNFLSWEAELEGSAPQWGLMTGRAAANVAIAWLTHGEKPRVDPSTVLGPVQAILYRVDWSSGFSAHFSVLCQNAENASALAQVLRLWRDSQRAGAGTPSGTAAPLSDMGLQTNGSRVELSASGTMETLDSTFRVATSGSAP